MEQALFDNLDRWGFPMVPWVRHAFKASLCKDPDHGIAMKLGLLDTNVEEFDTLRHIDLSKRTVEMDAWFTNNAMSNYAVEDWDSTLTLQSRGPLQHSFWKIHQKLGREIRHGSWTTLD
ncbi:hypothetical protein V8C35DRAFT_327767 [Trichoderma chlorosporum]